MSHAITKEEYEKAKKEAKEIYSKIGKIWCPIFDGYIVFNSAGFQHLQRKTGRHRTRQNQLTRFLLLPFAGEIIDAPLTIRYRDHQDSGIKVRFWAFHKVVNGIRARLIVRQIGNGKKHFLSIFPEYKQKSALT